MFKTLREKIAEWKRKVASDVAQSGSKTAVSESASPAKHTGVRSDSGDVRKDSVKDVYSDSLFAHRLTDKRLDELFWELELALLEADVAVDVISEIKENLKASLTGKKVRREISPDVAVEMALKDAVRKSMTLSACSFDELVKKHEKPVVILFVGINGTGKTTTIAKIANRLRKLGLTSVIAAGDTFRAGAIEQLERHSENLGIKLIKHKTGSDAAAVAYDAIEHAKARHRDVVLIDSAGRMQTNQNLMDEMKKIKRVAKPNMVIFVGDALAGNDVIEQARTFDAGIGVDGVILNKIDADVKGGAALSIAHAIRKPIYFVGTGQGYEDIIEFSPEWMTERIFSDT